MPRFLDRVDERPGFFDLVAARKKRGVAAHRIEEQAFVGFRAGFAESGAYNRTLTPFGFQNERRTFWDVPDLYARMSPFWHANQVKDPILVMHGEMDDNPGTFPIQSERMFAAIKGNGGNVRYVQLPLESHGYIAAESRRHVIWEMVTWLDTHVKGKPTVTP